MTIDLTGIIVAVIGGLFTVIGSVFLAWLQAHIKDKDAAATVNNAVKNSLGAIQQAATAAVTSYDPRIKLPPGAPPSIAVGVQYVLDHAGDEAKSIGITSDAIASKINAQIGLANIATNTAVAASPGATPKPLDPVAAPVVVNAGTTTP